MSTLHKNLTGADLHEPKGADTASATQVYVSDGSGSGNWLAIVPIGLMCDYLGTTTPAGFLFANGKTIGNASSNATAFANIKAQTLFTQLWNADTGNKLPIFDSSNTLSTKGANAAADWSANKAISLPDLRERVTVGLSTMGTTTSQDLLSGLDDGIDGSILFNTGGLESHVLLSAEMAEHTHDPGTLVAASHTHAAGTLGGSTSTDGSHTHNYTHNESTERAGSNGFSAAKSNFNTASTSSSGSHNHDLDITGSTASSGTLAITGASSSVGSGTAFNIVQPTFVCNKIIFYGG